MVLYVDDDMVVMAIVMMLMLMVLIVLMITMVMGSVIVDNCHDDEMVIAALAC